MLFQDLQLAIVDRLNSDSLFSQFDGMVFPENPPKSRTGDVRKATADLFNEALRRWGIAICVGVCEVQSASDDSKLIEVKNTICFWQNTAQNDLENGTGIEAPTFGESAFGLTCGWKAAEHWQAFRDLQLHQTAVGDAEIIWELDLTTGTYIDVGREIVSDELTNEVTDESSKPFTT